MSIILPYALLTLSVVGHVAQAVRVREAHAFENHARRWAATQYNRTGRGTR